MRNAQLVKCTVIAYVNYGIIAVTKLQYTNKHWSRLMHTSHVCYIKGGENVD